MKQSSIKMNFVYQLLYDVLIMILPFFTSPYIARVIGAEGLGIYSYYSSIATYFVLFSVLGLKNYGNRTIARCRDNSEELNKTFSNLLCLHLLISLVCSVVYLGCALTSDSRERIYVLIMTLQVLSGMFDISWFYFGIERFKLTVSINTVIKFLNLFCVFTLVKSQADLWVYCLIMAAGTLLSQVALWFPLRKYVKFVAPSLRGMFVHLKPMLILFVPSIAVSLYKYMDKIMIGSVSSKIQLGFYENAEKVINIPITVITSFGTVMLPKMSNMLAVKDQSESRRYLKVSMLYVMWMAYALAFGLAGVASVFAPVFWGTEFRLSGSIIIGLSITIPFMSFANVIRTQFLIPSGKDREFLVSVVSGAVVNLIINALLIPSMGSVGATIGTIAAEITVCIIQCFSVRKEIPLLSYFKQSVFFIAVGIVMMLLVHGIGIFVGETVIALFIQVICGGIVYITISGLYFWKTKEETFINMVNRARRVE